ncbi:MAG TPA: ubiquinol-cytochrome C chaperone family protein [Allosphingosinicella sp.]|nr:ubiquinol-cytochrome C chaperone family protein [Allosphingosinicella sp.]
MPFLARLLGRRPARAELRPLYDAIAAAARAPEWYGEGGIPDTLQGRFDMLAALMALVLLRLEAEGEDAKAQSVLLTEIFIDDMDATLRQLGIGDFAVGKHVGKLVGALGGRLGAFRAAFAGEAELEPAVRRNLFRDAASDEAVSRLAARLRETHRRLGETHLEDLLAGKFK